MTDIGDKASQGLLVAARLAVAEMQNVIDEQYAEIERLREALRKARRDIDSAEYGEGYQLNLPDIVRDIDAALKEQSDE
jgi:hypothetical protein